MNRHTFRRVSTSDDRAAWAKIYNGVCPNSGATLRLLPLLPDNPHARAWECPTCRVVFLYDRREM